MAGHPRWIRGLFTESDLAAIADAVTAAEATTSAEIRVHLERRLRGSTATAPGDPLERARAVFEELGMHRTALRHGVLIYVAVEDHRLAIVGDEGVHAVVGDGYWAAIRDLMVDRLRRREARAALVEALGELGRALARHFPRRPDDTNELSDSVSVER